MFILRNSMAAPCLSSDERTGKMKSNLKFKAITKEDKVSTYQISWFKKRKRERALYDSNHS